MKLSQVKSVLTGLSEVNFVLPDGTRVPEHFHVTEVGLNEKNFIDCGGIIRKEKSVSFQLWTSSDYDHRLKAKKMLDIISLSERLLDIPDEDVEVEFQSDTIGKYGLGFADGHFLLTAKQTACLASDQCGVPTEKKKVSLSSLSDSQQGCQPGSACCS